MDSGEQASVPVGDLPGYLAHGAAGAG
jgi:hypothetical protein